MYTLYKNYLEDPPTTVNTDPEMAGGPTEVMSEVLGIEADRRANNITISPFVIELGKSERKKLYPEFGKLQKIPKQCPPCSSRADDMEQVLDSLDWPAERKTMEPL